MRLSAALVVALWLAILWSPGRAIADGSDPEPATHPMAGEWSLQFKVDENFTLSSFQGSTISAKRDLASGNAVRCGVSLSGSHRDDDDSKVSEGGYFKQTSDSETAAIGVSLSAYYLRYLQPARRVSGFVGVGPVVGFSDTDAVMRDRLWLQPDTLYKVLEQREDGHAWSAGLHFLVGVEWFVAQHFSLSAEYGISASYYWYERERFYSYLQVASQEMSTDTRESATRYWSFGSGGVAVAVSVYF